MIGVAIPCYKPHAHLLPSLIENISKSSQRPDHIAISCSSWDHDRRTDTTYDGIPVSIQYSSRRLNQATNRNIAGAMLNTQLISFIDADDLMHPSRLEYIVRAFQGPYHAIYHGYTWEHVSHYSDPFNPVEYSIVSDPIVPYINGIGIRVDNPNHILHHAHVTVRRDVFHHFKFDQRPEAYRIEDSLYGCKLYESKLSLGFLAGALSRYIFTSTQ
jgi:hypothetical protein